MSSASSKWVGIWSLLCLLFVLAASASTEIPRKINYQGKLVGNATGEPLAGEHGAVFRIYDAASLGNLLWSETRTVTADSLGVFSVILGASPIDITFAGPCWLEIVVDGETLAPRREIASVPYAFQADMLDGSHADAFADSAHNHDGRYYTQTQLAGSGVVNAGANPVDWTKLKSVPAGFADGVDNVGLGDGHSLDAADGDPTDAVSVDNNGYVGIGTATPYHRLEVIEPSSDNFAGAIRGLASSPTSAGQQIFGVQGETACTTVGNSGAGVAGYASAPTGSSAGVKGECNNEQGSGVYAWATHATGVNYGVYGRTSSPNGYAAYFLGGRNYFNGKVGIGTPYPGTMLDVRASSGTAISADGGSDSAISATSSGSTIPTIAANHTGSGPAVYGTTEGGYPCVEGLRESSGIAVAGYVTVGGTAILGSAGSESGIGVMGVQAGISPDIATYYNPGGLFGGENGVIGYSETEDGFGVFGKSNGDNGWAGAFISTANGVRISSSPTGQGLTVTGGPKSAAVRTSDGTRLLYCEEASEVWFADYGFGKLEGGVAVVPIDPVFAQTVSLAEPYHVFTEAYGNAEIYVAGRTADKFEVRLRDGDPNVEFSYRIVAKRAGFEKKRLDRASWADNDRNLYPEKQAKVQGE